MRLNATFRCKESEYEEQSCVVEKIIELSADEFEFFRRNMLEHFDFIKENSDLMYQKADRVNHCLLVLGKDQDDGILVESEGWSYAKYTAFVPNARQLVELQHTKQLAEEKTEQDETTELILSEDSAETTAYLANAHNCVDADERFSTLLGMLGCNFEDVHLCHCDEEHDLATISELNQNTLTEQGKSDWSDVLSGKVHRIYQGNYGLQMELSGVKAERLSDFSYMLAGQCSAEDYDRWVQQDDMGLAEEKTEQDQEESSDPALSM